MGGFTLQYITHLRFFKGVLDNRDPSFRNFSPRNPLFFSSFQSEQFDLDLTEVWSKFIESVYLTQR